MKIRVLLFAAARQQLGRAEVELELAGEPAPRIADLRAAMAREFPALQPLLAVSNFAMDSLWCTEETRIECFSEVALIPPVSGG